MLTSIILTKMINKELKNQLNFLEANELPALPVAPVNNDILNKNNKPIYTGKNPSYVDEFGNYHIIKHCKYQNQLPSEKDHQKWFNNPQNGIGTLGGWNNIFWIDIDVKNFENEEKCDQVVQEWINKYPVLKNTFIEKTQSGGYRLAIKLRTKPTFTNFTFEPNGKHKGEILGGR